MNDVAFLLPVPRASRPRIPLTELENMHVFRKNIIKYIIPFNLDACYSLIQFIECLLPILHQYLCSTIENLVHIFTLKFNIQIHFKLSASIRVLHQEVSSKGILLIAVFQHPRRTHLLPQLVLYSKTLHLELTCRLH